MATDHGTIAAPLAPVQAVTPVPAGPVDDEGLVEDDLLVEEISIDGMCGVY